MIGTFSTHERNFSLFAGAKVRIFFRTAKLLSVFLSKKFIYRIIRHFSHEKERGLTALVVCQSPRWFSAVRLRSSETYWPMPHATGRCDGRQEGRECGYYHLHRYLDDPLLHTLLHFFTLALLMASARCSLGPDPNVISLMSQRGLSPSVLRLEGLSRSSVHRLRLRHQRSPY